MNLERVLPYATPHARSSRLHGPDHWRRVAEIGAELARETPGADPHVVELFATLHDTQRHGDGHDPDHGRRAADLALELRGSLFEATDEQLFLLAEALGRHADGFIAGELTIAVCWDADRLDLGRCGIQPEDAFFSTSAARRRGRAASRDTEHTGYRTGY